MDELFRFAVTRAPDKTDAVTLPLHRLTNFQDRLYKLVVTLKRPTWPNIEPPAERFLRDKLALMQALKDLNGQTPDAALADKLDTFGIDLNKILNATNTTPSRANARGVARRVSTLPGALTAALRPLLQDDAALDSLASRLCDLFLALMIFRASGPLGIERLLHPRPISAANLTLATLLQQDHPSLEDVARYLRLINVVRRLITDPAAFPTEATVRVALRMTLMLPPRIFAYFRRPVQPVGITDLLVVKQHILRYEMGEIARIENILKGETRTHRQKHTLSNERETLFETDKTTETEEELTARDHISIRTETENILKEELAVDAGVHAQYDGGSYQIQADVTTAYNRSSSESRKLASEMAKDVTQRAAKKVSDRVRQSTRTKIVEAFEDTESQEFRNRSRAHISGVYQWVEKVYLAQVFNYGRHLLFDVMVPEPGANLLAASFAELEGQQTPIPPKPFTVPPLDLSEDPDDPNDHFYGKYVALYGVTGVEPPPPETITLSMFRDVPTKDDSEKSGDGVIRIDDGYGAYFARGVASWKTNDNTKGGIGKSPEKSHINLTVGGETLLFETTGQGAVPLTEPTAANERLFVQTVERALNPFALDQPREERTISWGFKTNLVNGMTLNLEILCKRTGPLFAKWQLQTYDKIALRYQKLLQDYETALSAQRFSKKQEGILANAPPEVNRITERNELKRSCIGVLTKNQGYIDGHDALIPSTLSPLFHDPDPERSDNIGSVVRFLEQAFEWDKISYVLYPYFWGRSDSWVYRLQLKYESDPLFEQFLRAGYARVVIPVRNNFEEAVNFFLLTGQPWMGGGLPSLGDDLYLPITEEIKEQTGAPGEEKPVGDPWYIRIPTRLIKLRTGKDKEELPEWTRTPPRFNVEPPEGPWNWKPLS